MPCPGTGTYLHGTAPACWMCCIRAEVSRLADELDVGITAHWAEVQNNVDYTVETFGMLPAEFAQIDILVNNAGLGKGLDKLHLGNPDGWEQMILLTLPPMKFARRQKSKRNLRKRR